MVVSEKVGPISLSPQASPLHELAQKYADSGYFWMILGVSKHHGANLSHILGRGSRPPCGTRYHEGKPWFQPSKPDRHYC